MRTLLVLLCCLAACEPKAPAPVAKAPDPELTLTKKVLEAGVCETRVRLTFNLKNRRKDTLRVAKWTAEVKINEQTTTQEKTLELKLFSQDEATFDVPLSVDRGCSQAASRPADATKETSKDGVQPVDAIHIKGQIFAVADEDLIFEFEDSFELQTPKTPELVAELRAQKYDYGRIDMYLVFTLHNPNGFTVLVDNVVYKLKLGSEIVAQGETMVGEKVPNNHKSRVEIPVELAVKKGVGSDLFKKGKIDFNVEAKLNVAGMTEPYSKSGTFSF